MCRLPFPLAVLLFAGPLFADDPKPFPKPLKDGEKPRTNGWFGKTVLPKRSESDIRMGDWKDGKQETWTPHALLECNVREDRDGFLRVFDLRREGWVSKDDMVTAEDAPAYFDQAVKDRPTEAVVWQMRAHGRLTRGEHDKAIVDLTEAIRLKPDDSHVVNSRGIAWRAKGENDKAIADYTEAIRLDPKNTIAFCNRGNARLDKREPAKAVADYTEAIDLDPQFALAYCNRGLAWLQQGEYDKAVADCTAAIKLDPKDVTAFDRRARAWRGKKELDKVIADYSEVIRLAPAVTAYQERGELWRDKKEYVKAIADYSDVIRLAPKDSDALTRRGHLYAKTKEYGKAVADYEAALTLDPKAETTLNNAAWTLATCADGKVRDGKKAVGYAKRQVEVRARWWGSYDTLAAAYAEAGEFELAIAEQRKAVEMLKAEKSADKDELKKAEARLELYRAKKPYRDEE